MIMLTADASMVHRDSDQRTPDCSSSSRKTFGKLTTKYKA